MLKARKKDRNALLLALGEAVRRRRVQLALSQQQLGDRANLHRTYITDLENGLRNMSLLTLLKVCNALELPLSQLIADAEALPRWTAGGADSG